ncbi:helicase-associated domain-containing protein [Kitasatospora sp. NBC_00240]|uniref:helicase-associated domain-containing protein n=1 Tax=Kitasatospora sp. NBC_00240 TaxID=2903567 RepID=UPI00225653CA|nr:helicase-associated domain-containing protein [Kitasatospora sp. NBC_00240]MCX5212345.1 helicase-associated domain-containing protein [Kitasatospora sp. NBC_00240]
MTSADALMTWLTTRTAEQLTELLEQRRLPWTGAAGLDDPARLAEQLLGNASVATALTGLNTAETQVLTAIAVLAERLHGPAPRAAGPAGLSGFAGTQAAYRQGLGGGSGADPAERAVPRSLLLDALGGRAATELDALAGRALLLPPHGERLTVPGLLHERVPELRGLGRPAGVLLTSAYRAAEIARVADELGLPPSRNRDQAQSQVEEHLGDAERLRATLADAPPQAAALLAALAAGPPRLHTYCFVSDTGGYYGSGGKFLFRPDGSGDPGADWLADRGLLVPVGPDIAELPREVALALRDPAEPLPYDPLPPAVLALVPLPAGWTGEAQATATVTASRVELLLRSTAAQPLSVRKAGGVAVRDTKRLAKASGSSEEQARLWLDLAANAGLVAPHRDAPPPTRGRRPAPPQPARILPTARYDEWLVAPPAGRLVPLIATWAVTPEVFGHRRDAEEVPVALVTPQDRSAVPLRHALLEALARLPDGYGIGPAAATGDRALGELLAGAAWFRPDLLDTADPAGALTGTAGTAGGAGTAAPGADTLGRAAATLREAELLGVVAHGALTPVGHAVLALLRAGADRWFPAVPGTGVRLTRHPALRTAVDALRTALADLVPPPRTTARFQADLTAVVAGSAAPELTELLSAVADRESEGHAVVWRIGPASVRRALDAGSDATELAARLAEVSEGGLPLPQALEYLLRDTARTHGRMRVVRSACCVRSDDEALVLELSKVRSLARIGLRRIAPTVLISTAPPEETLAALRTAGYAPVLEAETGTTVVERAAEERAENPMPSLAQARRFLGRGPATAAELAAAVLGLGPAAQDGD